MYAQAQFPFNSFPSFNTLILNRSAAGAPPRLQIATSELTFVVHGYIYPEGGRDLCAESALAKSELGLGAHRMPIDATVSAGCHFAHCEQQE